MSALEELQGLLIALPDRARTVVELARVRDKAAGEGRPEWAALWAFLAAELAELDAEAQREWSEFTRAHPVPWPKADRP